MTEAKENTGAPFFVCDWEGTAVAQFETLAETMTAIPSLLRQRVASGSTLGHAVVRTFVLYVHPARVLDYDRISPRELLSRVYGVSPDEEHAVFGDLWALLDSDEDSKLDEACALLDGVMRRALPVKHVPDARLFRVSRDYTHEEQEVIRGDS